MIHIQKIALQDPFAQYPYLKDIWPKASSSIAQEATKEAIDAQELGIYLVMKDYVPISMSGYFINGGVYHLGLRWHGIIASERGKGYSKEAMKIFFEQDLIDYRESPRPEGRGFFFF